jgi:hypothetical protein
MKPSFLLGFVSGLSLLAAVSASTADAGGPTRTGGAWAERVQVVYLAETRSVVRKTVRVWDPHPEMNLDFVWEPAEGTDSGIAADGTISGRGKLVWRVRGSASYDPKTIYSLYRGDMRDGRPNGKGRFEIRTGEVFEGEWSDGLLEGKGMHVDADGNRYEGMFSAGVPNGEGRLLSRNGEIFEGTFVDGLKQGKGRTRLAGGTVYESEWDKGREIGGRPDLVADATVGGLLKAQSGGGAADKVDIGVVVDQRMTQQSEMQYQHLVRDEDIAIYPVDPDINGVWNGTAEINGYSGRFDSMDWENAPAFVEVDVGTTDGSRVKFQGLELQVQSSQAYRKPMLSLQPHMGCVGFRPSFSFKNNGWGDVQNASISIQFTGETPLDADEGGDDSGAQLGDDKNQIGQDEGDGGAAKPAASRTFTKPIGNFGNGTDVYIDDLLREAGVDTQKLTDERFSCQSMDSINVCRSQVFNSVGFGEIADFVWGDQKLKTTVKGTLSYSWTDDYGNSYQQNEPFQVDISLAYIEVPNELAECGDGFGGSPEALRYQDIDLPINQQNYVIDLPMRGNKNLASYVARLKMHSQMSSFHQFQAVAKFADGSERRSKTVSFFYYRPKPSDFVTSATPAACYLPPEAQGC